MSATLKKFNKIIPIGYICSLSGLLIKLDKRDSATAFEHMACPMWAVNELMSNNFSGFLQNTSRQRVFENSPDEYIVDQQYYIRLLPNGAPANVLQARAAKLPIALSSAANSNQSVLFLRWSERMEYENLGARIGFERFSAKYQKSELEYCTELVSIIKQQYPTLNFKILLLSGDQAQAVDANLLVLPEPRSFDYRSPTVVKDLEQHLQQHVDILQTHL